MTERATARSISKQIHGWQDRRQARAHVLFVGRRACNLLLDQDAVISLVDPRVDDGPFNIVIDDVADLPIRAQAGCRVAFTRDWLCLDALCIDLQRARVWDPCPDWDALGKRRDQVRSNLPLVRGLCAQHGTASAFAPLLGLPGPRDALSDLVIRRAPNAVADLRAGWAGSSQRLARGASALAGLGTGLTPAGDDFMLGVMLWAWVAHPAPGRFCDGLLRASAARTTALSAAFLRAAARGACSAPWHALLAALRAAAPGAIDASVGEILRRGASSGADALLGFLCMPRHG